MTIGCGLIMCLYRIYDDNFHIIVQLVFDGLIFRPEKYRTWNWHNFTIITSRIWELYLVYFTHTNLLSQELKMTFSHKYCTKTFFASYPYYRDLYKCREEFQFCRNLFKSNSDRISNAKRILTLPSASLNNICGLTQLVFRMIVTM